MFLDSKLTGIRGKFQQLESGTDSRKRDGQAVLGTAATAQSWDGNTANTWTQATSTAVDNSWTSMTSDDGLWTQTTDWQTQTTDWETQTQTPWQADAENWSTTSVVSYVQPISMSAGDGYDSTLSEATTWQSTSTQATTSTTPCETDSSSTSTSDDSPSATVNPVDDNASVPASSTSVHGNTWITSTTVIPIPSGQTVTPLITFGQESTPTSGVPSLAGSAAAAPETTSGNAGSSPTLVHSSNINGSSSLSHSSGSVNVGIAVGSVVGVLLILLAAFVYIRGGTMRGLAYKPKSPPGPDSPIFSSRKKSLGPAWIRQHGQHREPIKTSPDLETAGKTPRLWRGDNEKWDVIDVNDPRSGNLEDDGGEWLEDWRRRKEMMMSKPGPPELQFNPDLPLPPISTRSLEVWDRNR